MKAASLPADEPNRLAALARYEVLDTAAESAFDDYTHLAALVCAAPISLISLVDAGRQWFKSSVGLAARETPRELAFCAHAILHDELMEVPNALEDLRFHDNPLVTGAPDIRFYAGAPLITPDHHALGTLCVIDRVPRRLAAEQRDALVRLGRQLVILLELRLATARLRRQTAHQQRIADAIDEGFLALDPSGRVLFANVAARTMLGQPDLAGKAAYDIVTSCREDGVAYPTTECPIQATLRDGAPRKIAGELFRRPDGVMLAVDYSVTAIRGEADELTGVAVAFRDIAERRAAEVAMRRLAALVESAEEAICAKTLDGVITHWNPASERLFGYSAQEIVGRRYAILIPSDHANEEEARLLAQVARGERAPTLEVERLRKDGTLVSVATSASPIVDSAGRVVGVARIARDITRRKQREAALVRVSALVESAEEAILAESPDGLITSANPAAERLYGYPAAELVGQRYAVLVPPARALEEPAILQRLASGEGIGSYETERLRKDGTIVSVSATISPIKDGAGRIIGLSNISQDITARKRTAEREKELLRLFSFEADAALALTGNATLDVLLQACTEAFVKHLDAAFARIWTLNASEAVLVLRASAGQYTHLDGPHARVPLGKLKIGLIAQEQKSHLTNDVAGDPRISDQEWARREGMVAFAGYPLVTSGRVVGVMAMFARRPLSQLTLNAMGSVSHSVALAIERSRTDALLHAKNDELKGFAYTVSHDLKAPLRGILGYARELERKHRAGLGERAVFCVGQIVTATRNLDRLIEDLLEYSRLDREFPTLTRVDLAELVTSVLRDLERTIGEQGTQISVALPSASVVGWERGLRQVFANLIDNAVKYSRHATPPRIRIAGEEVEGAYRVAVTDNGIGFEMKYHDRLFGLFNRLVRAEDFEGTGAGLAIVRKVLDKQRGKIWAEAEPGKGATFFVELPTEDPRGAL